MFYYFLHKSLRTFLNLNLCYIKIIKFSSVFFWLVQLSLQGVLQYSHVFKLQILKTNFEKIIQSLHNLLTNKVFVVKCKKYKNKISAKEIGNLCKT